jgi:hypothetical protein
MIVDLLFAFAMLYPLWVVFNGIGDLYNSL